MKRRRKQNCLHQALIFFLVGGILVGRKAVGLMHQCSTMLLSIVSSTACGPGANPSVALRNARSLPSCLELQLLAYKSSQKRDAAGEHIGDESISRAFSPSNSRARKKAKKSTRRGTSRCYAPGRREKTQLKKLETDSAIEIGNLADVRI